MTFGRQSRDIERALMPRHEPARPAALTVAPAAPAQRQPATGLWSGAAPARPRTSRRSAWGVAALLVLALITVVSAAREDAAPTPGVAAGLSGQAVPMAAVQRSHDPATVANPEFRYDAPPSISRDDYIAIVCLIDSPACPEAGDMYDILTNPNVPRQGIGVIDPATEAAQAMHESGLGTSPNGVGRQPTLRPDGSVDPCCGGRNLHGVQCFAGDGRIADLAVEWGNHCAAVYPDYKTSVRTWKKVILTEYVAVGLNMPAKAVSTYAPVGDCGGGVCNNPPAYIRDMERWMSCWHEKMPSTCYAERGISVRRP